MKNILYIFITLFLGCSPSLKYSKAYINAQKQSEMQSKKLVINSISPDDIIFFSDTYFKKISNPKDMLSEKINTYLGTGFKEKLKNKIAFISSNSANSGHLKISRIINEEKIEWTIPVIESHAKSLGLFLKDIKFRKIGKLAEINVGPANNGIQHKKTIKQSNYNIKFNYLIWDYESKNSIAYGEGNFLYKPFFRVVGHHFEGNNVWYKQLKKIPDYIIQYSPLTGSYNKKKIEFAEDIDPITGVYKDDEGEHEEILEEPE